MALSDHRIVFLDVCFCALNVESKNFQFSLIFSGPIESMCAPNNGNVYLFLNPIMYCLNKDVTKNAFVSLFCLNKQTNKQILSRVRLTTAMSDVGHACTLIMEFNYFSNLSNWSSQKYAKNVPENVEFIHAPWWILCVSISTTCGLYWLQANAIVMGAWSLDSVPVINLLLWENIDQFSGDGIEYSANIDLRIISTVILAILQNVCNVRRDSYLMAVSFVYFIRIGLALVRISGEYADQLYRFS